MTGSHADSQPTGGRYDGIYGVLGGRGRARAERRGHRDRAPDRRRDLDQRGRLALRAGDGVGRRILGVYTLEYGLSRTDGAGRTIGEELARIGYAGAEPVGGYPVHAAYELHIEQGAILERAGKTIGVVTAGQGQRWYE